MHPRFLQRITTTASMGRRLTFERPQHRLICLYTVCLSATLEKFDLIDVVEVVAAIRVSPSKQCQFDSLPTWLLKDCIALLALFITHIINSSITAGCFLTPWKHAILSPLLKKSGLDEYTNKLSTSFEPDLPSEIA